MRIAQRVLAWERAPRASHVDITLLSAAAMRRTNARATGRRGLTDVIAYSLPQPDGRVVGDVYICPTAAAPPPPPPPQAPPNATPPGLRESPGGLAENGPPHCPGPPPPGGPAPPP